MGVNTPIFVEIVLLSIARYCCGRAGALAFKVNAIR